MPTGPFPAARQIGAGYSDVGLLFQIVDGFG